MLQYTGSINPNTRVFDSSPSVRRLGGNAPPKYASPEVQQHFTDLYRGAGQQAALDVTRASANAQNQYDLAAQQAINQNVLQGLSLAGQQRQDDADRSLAIQGQRYKMFNDLLGGGGILGGLL